MNSVLGTPSHRSQCGSDLQEYVLRCTWVGRESGSSEVTWLVAHRYKEFDDFNTKVNREPFSFLFSEATAVCCGLHCTD